MGDLFHFWASYASRGCVRSRIQQYRSVKMAIQLYNINIQDELRTNEGQSGGTAANQSIGLGQRYGQILLCFDRGWDIPRYYLKRLQN